MHHVMTLDPRIIGMLRVFRRSSGCLVLGAVVHALFVAFACNACARTY